MGKRLYNLSVEKCVFFIFILSVLCMIPITVYAEDSPVEILTTGSAQEFTHPAGDFTLEYEFTPEENGVYDIKINIANSSAYVLDYLISTESMGSSSGFRIDNPDESGYTSIYKSVMLADTKYTIKLTLNGDENTENGIGSILIDKEEVIFTSLNYATPVSINNNANVDYYCFTAPEDGAYQVEVNADESEEKGFGLVAVNYGTRGEQTYCQFYQGDIGRTAKFELLKGESVVIQVSYETQDTKLSGTLTVTDFFDNELKAYVAGTEQMSKVYYVPEGGSKTLSIDVFARDQSMLSYTWYKLTDTGISELLAEDVTFYNAVNQTDANINCLVEDQYGNFESVTFSLITLSGDLTGDIGEDNPVQISFVNSKNDFLYKYTAEKTGYYIVSTSQSGEPFYSNISCHSSTDLEGDRYIYNEGDEFAFKGNIFLNQGESIYILAHGDTINGNMDLFIEFSEEIDDNPDVPKEDDQELSKPEEGGSEISVPEGQKPANSNNNGADAVIPSTPQTPARVERSNVLVAGTTLNISNAVYTVTATGTTVEYKAPKNKTIKKITIPSSVTANGVVYKVTSISSNAFKNCKKLKKITISTGITIIGKNAFSGCKRLKNIIIKSKSLTKIEKNAFKGINKAAKIKVPKKKLNAYKKLLRKAKISKSIKIVR